MRSAALLALSSAVVLLAGCSVGGAATQPRDSLGPGYHGVQPATEPQRPRFTLLDTSNRPFDFAARTRGHATYLYFGYTHCPDDCPTAMADLAMVLRRQPAKIRDQLRVVLVTTDPARDTGPVMRRFLDQFSTTFIGLHGTAAQTAAAQNAAGVPVAQLGPVPPTIPGHPTEHLHKPGTAPHKHFGPLGYSVTHLSAILAYDVHDRLPVLYPAGITPADIAADLPSLLR